MQKQFTVYGRVQGVGFRFYTLREAQKLGLKGYVKNLSDGSVLAVAQGTEGQIQAFAQWLAQGSPSAKVERVLAQDYLGNREFSEFRVEYTYNN